MIEQGRADYAYRMVSDVIKNRNEIKKEYRSYIMRLPMMIKANGFGAAMAFYYSRQNKEQAYKVILQQIEEWLRNAGYIQGNQSLMQCISASTSDMYKLMTMETMALLLWLKRFTEGMIEENDR